MNRRIKGLKDANLFELGLQDFGIAKIKLLIKIKKSFNPTDHGSDKSRELRPNYKDIE